MVEIAYVQVTCQECHTPLGGVTGKHPFKHLMQCLKVESDALERIKTAYEKQGGGHAERVLHIVNALLAGQSQPTGEV